MPEVAEDLGACFACTIFVCPGALSSAHCTDEQSEVSRGAGWSQGACSWLTQRASGGQWGAPRAAVRLQRVSSAGFGFQLEGGVQGGGWAAAGLGDTEQAGWQPALRGPRG